MFVINNSVKFPELGRELKEPPSFQQSELQNPTVIVIQMIMKLHLYGTL